MSKQSEPTAAAGTGPGWILIALGDARYALAIGAVGEVLPVPALSPVPMTPDWVAGIADVRGEVIPVIDTGLRLHARAASRQGRLVLTHPDESGERVGLLVDAIAGLVERGVEPDVPKLDLESLLDPAAKI